MDAATLQVLAFAAAFWTALLGFAGRGAGVPGAEASSSNVARELGASIGAWRLVLGLALGAVFAHGLWALLHLPEVAAHPRVLLSPAVGYTVLAVPLGPLATAPWRAPAARRDAWLAAALGALPFALAVARLGCLAAGCCHGVPTGLPWGIRLEGAPPVHPTRLYEIAGLVALGLAVRRAPRAWVAPAVLAGFGVLRLAVEPWRAAPPLGAPWLPVWVPAAGWVLVAFPLSPRPLLPSRPRLAEETT